MRKLAVLLVAFFALWLVATDMAQAQYGFGGGFGGGRRFGGRRFGRPPVVFVQPFPQQRFLRQPRHVVVFDQFGRPVLIHNHGQQFNRFRRF